jgi:hypothetical protein
MALRGILPHSNRKTRQHTPAGLAALGLALAALGREPVNAVPFLPVKLQPLNFAKNPPRFRRVQ